MTNIDLDQLSSVTGGLSLDLTEMNKRGLSVAGPMAAYGAVTGAFSGFGAIPGAIVGGGVGYVAGAGTNLVGQLWRQR